MPDEEITPTPAPKPSGPSYSAVLERARSLSADHKLSNAWIREKLEVKKPSEFADSELAALDQALQKFSEEFEKNNTPA